jgi:hypothetical protein
LVKPHIYELLVCEVCWSLEKRPRFYNRIPASAVGAGSLVARPKEIVLVQDAPRFAAIEGNKFFFGDSLGERGVHQFSPVLGREIKSHPNEIRSRENDPNSPYTTLDIHRIPQFRVPEPTKSCS